ncbi:MAG: cysteine desulfurase [Legionellales bacterium]|nr:cysteine desulfurase [Legionellales bacterium]
MFSHNDYDVEKIRQDFPVLHQTICGKSLIYFDNAATTQKPQQVIDAVSHFYCHDNANIHRGIHTLSERATASYEIAREKVQHFIHAQETKEIIFTRGTTESINLLAQSYGLKYFKPQDEILVSEMEHHSNIVPWQLIAEKTGAVIKMIPITDAGEIDLNQYNDLFTAKTKLVAISHISNALGTINPLKEMITIAHQHGALVAVDAAQSLPHLTVDVQDLDCDFLSFSGHKLYAPTGIGVLYGKAHLLKELPPYQGGGSMIRTVSFNKTTYADIPMRFEAGTPNITGAIGLGAAIDYLNHLGMSNIIRYEETLTDYLQHALSEIQQVQLIGQAKHRTSVFSFILDDIHPHDIGTILNHEGIAVRSGHHCAMPIMEHFNVPATVRVSLAFYNTTHEIDALIHGLMKVREVFNR